MKANRKMLAARQSLERHLGIVSEREQFGLANTNPACVVRLDRAIFTADGYSADLILAGSPFHRDNGYWPTAQNEAGFLPYGRAENFRGVGSIKSFHIQ